MTDQITTVLVADDEPLIRAGLGALISAQPDLAVVGEAGDGMEVLPLVRELDPGVVLMDVRMPGMDGIETTRRLLAQRHRLGRGPGDHHLRERRLCLRGAARRRQQLLLKRARREEIAHAIRVVTTGDSLLFPDAVRRLVAARRTSVDLDPRGPASLTRRETEVLRLVATGRAVQHRHRRGPRDQP